MLNPEPTTIAQVIQLAIAPVFLLSSVGPMLIVLTNRLARIIDRYRYLAEDKKKRENLAILDSIEFEMRVLDRRGKFIHWSIAMCTSCALFICVLIAGLFFGSLFELKFSILVSSLFIIAMLLLIAGLLCFLREIHIATRSIYSVAKYNFDIK